MMTSEAILSAPPVMSADEMSEHSESAARLLKALANPHRLQILCVLGMDEMSVSELNERIPLSQSALSQHLAKLRADNLVETRRMSQTIYYRTKSGVALELISVLQTHFCPDV